MIDNYQLPRKNASFHMIILHRHPLGGKFQLLKIEGGQEAEGNGRNFSGRYYHALIVSWE